MDKQTVFLLWNVHGPLILLGVFSQRSLAEEAAAKQGTAKIMISQWQVDELVNPLQEGQAIDG